MKLHGCGKIQEHVRQIWTFTCQLVQDSMRYELNGKFYVFKRRTKSYATANKQTNVSGEKEIIIIKNFDFNKITFT